MSSVKTQPKKKPRPRPSRHLAPVLDQQQPRFVGIDLHKEIATFHILSHDGASLKSGSFRVDPDSIREFATIISVPPTTSPSKSPATPGPSSDWSSPHIANIVVSNPMKTKAIAEANIKTDKVDAWSLPSSSAATTCRASGCPRPTSRTNGPSPPDDRPWSTSAPPSATESTRYWHAGWSKHPREDSLPKKGSPGSSTSTSTHWTEP